METTKLEKLNHAQVCELQKTVTESVLNSVLRGIPLSDICRMTPEDTPEWIRGSALVINKIMQQLVGTSVNVDNSEHKGGGIIHSMPTLEWAPNNLTGHGGTEVNGRWYYTYDQALAAAAELGDGWRLPTAEEFEQLCDAGSTWVYKGPDGMPGRWFGGNHATDHKGSVFFPASGYRNRTSGALTNVGSYGYCWSSSPYSSGSTNAGNLYFNATAVNPLCNSHRANGFPVRCVREL